MQTANDSNLSQLQQQVLQLTDTLQRVHTAVAGLSARLQEDSIQINALVRHLTDTQSTQLLQERLADFAEQMNADHEQLNYLSGQLNHLATQEQLVRLATQVASQESMGRLTELIEVLGRAQERANLLASTKEQQLESALATLREIVDRRVELDEKNQIAAQAETEAIRRAARGELAVDLLPALDTLELLQAQAQTRLERLRKEYAALSAVAGPDGNSPGNASFFTRWRGRMGGDVDADSAQILRGLPDSARAALEELDEWLHTLVLLRDRVLGILRNEGVEPIIVVQQLFDPHFHLSVGSEPRGDVAPQTVIREMRKGYRQGMRTLRHSEVIVAKRASSGK